MVPLVGYLLLFVIVGVGFIFVHLMAGKFIRPNKPDAEKKTIYECGEPTIGSAWIQFDLRFYVVALLFVIFDVEVAFFFPWAEVFGTANNVVAMDKPTVSQNDTKEEKDKAWQAYGKQVNALIPAFPENKSLRDANLGPLSDEQFASNHQAARSLAWLALLEIAVFFGVLLVGFAYLWKRGDLTWVRSTLAEQPARATVIPPAAASTQQLVGAGS